MDLHLHGGWRISDWRSNGSSSSAVHVSVCYLLPRIRQLTRRNRLLQCFAGHLPRSWEISNHELRRLTVPPGLLRNRVDRLRALFAERFDGNWGQASTFYNGDSICRNSRRNSVTLPNRLPKRLVASRHPAQFRPVQPHLPPSKPRRRVASRIAVAVAKLSPTLSLGPLQGRDRVTPSGNRRLVQALNVKCLVF